MNNNSMKIQTHLILLLLFFHCYIGSCSELSILLSMKRNFIDPLNRLQDWELPKTIEENTSIHCNWTGVMCNSEGFIDKLDLSRMNLSGSVSDQIHDLRNLSFLNLCCNEFSSPLPKSLSNLTELEFIDLSQNSFNGSFPMEFVGDTRLKSLNATGNNFSGQIPESLGNAVFLETLDLRGNCFQGSIPKTFQNLGKLIFLGLSGNNLTGKLPAELGQMSSLETMIIGYNCFEGEIPKEFGNITSLRYLDLAVSNLSGTIPADLGMLKLLNTIFLYNNYFEGEIPPEIGNLTALQELDFSDNALSGEIPEEIMRLKNLQLLNLMCNKLSGSVPVGFSQLTQLQVLELWNNSLSGPLPTELGRNSPLQWLDISSNSFSGQIPSTLCYKGNLTKLIVFNNAFSGSIPIELSICSSLVRIRMHNNLLSGTIPIGFGKLEKLQRLELANNTFTGKIPNDLSSSSSLSFIDFSRNQLKSFLPSTIFSIPNLQNFAASENDLFGEIPDQFQDCPSLLVLDLSCNHFTGSIPVSIASFEKLVTLNLHSNLLTGPIPKSIAMMPTLSVLDLSNNSLTGGLPENFGNSPALETVNISHNKLDGPVPDNGMLRTINPDNLIGNAGLCGGVLPPCPNSSAYKNHRLHKRHIVVGYIIGFLSLFGVLILFIGAKSLYKRWYSNGSCFEERLEMGREDWPWRLLAFQKLGFTTNEILSCIKEANVIGKGATGTVYKAEISRSNAIVAVKKLWKFGSDVEIGEKNGDLVREVNVLGRLRHRNIVRLLGFVHNDTDAMIIYEYMQNGSLGEALHGKQKGSLLVDWVLRYDIAVGIAQGLAYLHHDCHPPVIHRDVKSNNILLNSNLEARIADFGLARLMIKKNETVSMVAGSYGYIAPEYGYTLKVDEKSDIYSFGVVLMELLTGKRPLEPEFGESIDIVEWMRNKIRDRKCIEAALDHNMGNCKYVKEEMLLVLRIALICTAKLPKDRPSMRDVVSMLREAKPRRKGTAAIEGNAVDKEKPVFSPSRVNG